MIEDAAKIVRSRMSKEVSLKRKISNITKYNLKMNIHISTSRRSRLPGTLVPDYGASFEMNWNIVPDGPLEHCSGRTSGTSGTSCPWPGTLFQTRSSSRLHSHLTLSRHNSTTANLLEMRPTLSNQWILKKWARAMEWNEWLEGVGDKRKNGFSQFGEIWNNS